MDLKQMQYFLCLAEEKNVTRAARREEARIKLLTRADKLALITEVKLARPLEDRPFVDLDVQKRVALAVVGP